MDNKQALEVAGKKKAHVGEMESAKINKCCWIAVVVAGVLGLAFIIVESLLRHYSAFAIGAIFYAWAGVFYFCQFFIAKRKYVGIIVGGSLHLLATITMIVLYVLFNVGGM